ncbi:hypothetical protein [Sphingobium sp. Cam5-1]|uniref:hypothetical protein n=1 Tax=Sphingobium sp. Cam5-1 TaxID=2789327 RepID=UPI0018AD2B5F|nr:hypothetical protein [Sphingobium sp. Cam5-1]QPI72109.1 hypothetical protein IZV00_09335 [Sphingobium sp. Cam5-1]
MIAAPRQHLTDEEKALIKEGKAADEIWPDEPAKANQKDIDARWTMKRGSLKRRGCHHRHQGRSGPTCFAH